MIVHIGWDKRKLEQSLRHDFFERNTLPHFKGKEEKGRCQVSTCTRYQVKSDTKNDTHYCRQCCTLKYNLGNPTIALCRSNQCQHVHKWVESIKLYLRHDFGSRQTNNHVTKVIEEII